MKRGPTVKGHDSLVAIDHPMMIRDRRFAEWIEQRSSLYGLLREGQGHV